MRWPLFLTNRLIPFNRSAGRDTRSVRLAARINAAKGPDVQTELVKGARGSFEVIKDGVLVFSKLTTGRFPASEDEVVKLL